MTKHMASFICIVSLASLSAHTSHARYYDIDFEPPVHTAGSTPAVGPGIHTPSRIVFGQPTVQTAFGLMTSQCLVFNPPSIGTHEQIKLNLGCRSGNYHLSFDLVTYNLNDSDYNFAVHFETPLVQVFSFHGLGKIDLYNPGTDFVYNHAGPFSDAQFMHVLADVNLAGGTWFLTINDNMVHTGGFYSSGGDVDSIRFTLSPWKHGTPIDPSIFVALDNILVIPEPSTLCIFLFGSFGVAFCNRQKQG